MKLSFITPTSFIKKFGSQSDFILALSHMLPSGGGGSQGSWAYENEIKDTGLPIILDNGLFEKHSPEPIKSLIDKAMNIGAHTFFAPDHLYNAERTKIELDYAIALNKYHKTGIKIGAVIQGNTPEEYLEQLHYMNGHPDVDLIGLSILSIPHCFESVIGEYNITKSRIWLLNWMKQYSEERKITWKKMHLLGIGDSYEDVIFASKWCPWVVSNDSSCAFQSGLFGKKLNDKLEVPGGKIKQKVEFGLMYLDEQKETDIQHNIDIIKKVVQGEEKGV